MCWRYFDWNSEKFCEDFVDHQEYKRQTDDDVCIPDDPHNPYNTFLISNQNFFSTFLFYSS
jgi:hypothetical protein